VFGAIRYLSNKVVGALAEGLVEVEYMLCKNSTKSKTTHVSHLSEQVHWISTHLEMVFNLVKVQHRTATSRRYGFSVEASGAMLEGVDGGVLEGLSAAILECSMS
jgi:hypothetical protein